MRNRYPALLLAATLIATAPSSFGQTKTQSFKPAPRIPLTFPAAPSDPPPTDTNVVWRGGSKVDLCDRLGRCISRMMPKATGRPIAVVPGPFLDLRIAAASWITVSNLQYSLCNISTARTKNVLSCVPVRAPVFVGASLRVLYFHNGGYLLTFAKVAAQTPPNQTHGEHKQAAERFGKALAAAQVAATHIGTKRYAGKLIPMKAVITADGDGSVCQSDWDGILYCEGGNDGGWGGGGDGGGDGGGGAPSGADDGGGYGDDGGQVPISPALPPLIPTAPNSSGGTSGCTNDGSMPTCTITAPDPNRTDPETGQQLPPGHPNDGPWYCDWPILRDFFCGSAPPPVSPPPPPSAPPSRAVVDDTITPPFIYPAPKPGISEPIGYEVEEGKQDEYERESRWCLSDYEADMKMADAAFALLGGPVYQDKIDNGERLTAGERKRFNIAKIDYASRTQDIANELESCLSKVRDKYRKKV